MERNSGRDGASSHADGAAATNSTGAASATDATVAAAAAPASASAPSRRANITYQAKVELVAYFDNAGFQHNDRLPQTRSDETLNGIATRHDLSRAQIRTQYNKWKGRKFGNTNVVLTADPQVLSATLSSLPPEDFVANVLKVIGSGELGDSNIADEEDLRFYKVLDAAPGRRDIIKGWCDDEQIVYILEEVVSFYGSTAASVFPATAAGVKSAESSFFRKRLEKRQEICKSKDWKEKKPDGTDSFEWDSLFGFVEICLFLVWTRMMVMEDDRPSLNVPSASSVSPHAMSSCYSVASWALSRVDKAPNEYDKYTRDIFKDFAACHSMTAEEARDLFGAEVTAVVDKREKKSLFRCDKDFFDLILMVESWYLENLNLANMIAYANGDIIREVKRRILDDDNMCEMLKKLCSRIPTLEDSPELRNELFGLINLKYARMRGQAFWRSMNSQIRKGTYRHDEAETRTKLAALTQSSKKQKTSSATEPIESFYEGVNEAVVDMPADDDIENEMDVDRDSDDAFAKGDGGIRDEDEEEDEALDDE